MSSTVRITSKNQITLPSEVRRALGIAAGGRVQLIVEEGGKVSIVAKKTGLRHLKGLFAKVGAPVDVDQAIAETVERRAAGERQEEDP